VGINSEMSIIDTFHELDRSRSVGWLVGFRNQESFDDQDFTVSDSESARASERSNALSE